MKLISLGGNCSITYQLIKLNLRSEAYPFDWTKISINQLINVLENNFDGYSETLEIKYMSDKHFLSNNEKALVLQNSYNITFSHEINKNDDFNTFQTSIRRRIIRFREINSEKIIFIRIELTPIKISYENNIKQLIKLLDNYSNNYELRLIINSNLEFNLPNNVKIYRYNKFSEDWQMNHLIWTDIFSVV
jgi:hypothetical protein